jgi:2-polyprenyl-3-methyl-5-hydroxy-6-metoxy-1,4-benzoquinol methylase
MVNPLRELKRKLRHWFGRITGRYYVEDHRRVYPDGKLFDKNGQSRPPSEKSRKNYLNHSKFYRFAAQFAPGARIADIGCGSGYGCRILKDAGAAEVHGADASANAIEYCRQQFADCATFSVQEITSMRAFTDGQFDVVVCSEVMEHIKDYGKEQQALRELKRIARPAGLVVVATPNSELHSNHGFSYDEITALFKAQFRDFLLFENALVPFGSAREAWERRSTAGRTGTVVSEVINLDETVLPDDAVPELKRGKPPGEETVGRHSVQTRLLHNTHSWVVVASKEA